MTPPNRLEQDDLVVGYTNWRGEFGGEKRDG